MHIDHSDASGPSDEHAEARPPVPRHTGRVPSDPTGATQRQASTISSQEPVLQHRERKGDQMLGTWFEVWIDDTGSKPYLLIVTHDDVDPSRILVIDPIEGYKTVHHENEYDAVKLWLLEDEYRRVDGRMENVG